MNDNSRLVYSTETGSHCNQCGKPTAECTCRKKKKSSAKPSVKQLAANFERDGIVRIQREVKGRKGKCVSAIHGLPTNADFKQIAKQLKATCGTGGSVKDGIIIMQGDHREKLKVELEKQGFRVKLAGG